MNIRRLYDRIPIRLRISFGLVGMMTGTLLLASGLGFFPNEQREILRGRAKMCEAIAISSTAMASSGNVSSVQVTLESVVARDKQIRSMSLVQQDGESLVVAGPHGEAWISDVDQSINQMRVPVFRHGKEWGELQVAFESTAGFAGLNYWAPAWLLILMIPACLIQFSFFLRKTLESLDPNGAVPDHVQGALNTLTVGLLLIDGRGRVLFANQEFENAIDVKSGNLVGTKASGVNWILPSEESLLPWEHCEQTGEMVHSQILQFDRDGRRLTFSVNCAPILGQGYMVTMEDITILEENKAELAKARDAAEQASESKSAFLANMSHEIRTPLNAVLGFTDVLRRGLVTDSNEAVDHLNMIHRSGAHLLELINDILDLSKIEAGRMQVETIETHIDEIVLDVIDVLDVRAKESDLRLVHDFKTPIPRIIQSDPTRLRQVITNLVGNAIKFTSEGEVKVAASLIETHNGVSVKLDVIDSGIGMTPEQQSKIFEAFSQADETTTRKFGGTGLGLSISRRLAEAMGGELSVASEPNVGSTFSVTIPISETEASNLITPEEVRENAERRADAAAKSDLTRLPAKHILVVDDGDANRQLIDLVLTRAGAKVTTVENGLEAIKALSEQDYSLVFMDMQMPVMDGYTATSKLRECGVKTPIVALTGNAMKGDRDKCMAAGCDDFLSKPVNLDALLERTAHYIGTGTPADVDPNANAKPRTTAMPVNQRATSTPTSETACDTHGAELIQSTLPMDDEDFRQIVADFIDRLDGRLDEIEQAIGQADFPTLQGQAHWLKGAGGTVGLGVFTQPAKQLEDAAKSSDAEQAAHILSTIRELQSRLDYPGRATDPPDEPIDEPIPATTADSVSPEADSVSPAADSVSPADWGRDQASGLHQTQDATHPIGETDVMSVAKTVTSNKAAGTATASNVDDGRFHTTLPVDDADFCEIVIDFIARLDDQLLEMGRQLEQRDFQNLSERAHWLKGAGGTVGFPQLMEPSQALLLASRGKSFDDAARHMRDILAVRERMVIPERVLAANA
tara:strand:+ start:1381 stop:4467 length:3087 start_codon:yes stop_codon:yes gene_type:complete